MPIRAGQRHRLSGRDHPLHPRERALLPRLRRQLHERARDHLSEDFKDTEDLDGLFSGWDAEKGQYDIEAWMYEGVDPRLPAGARELTGEPAIGAAAADPGRAHRPDAAASALRLPDPEAPFRALHAGDGGGDLRQSRTRCSSRSPKTLCRNSGRERTSAFCYAVGWTQHTVGRAVHPHRGDHSVAARQHGTARRRHHGAARPRLHSGLDRHPDALQPAARLSADAASAKHDTDFETYIELNESPSGWWGEFPKYSVSLLKAWYGDAATAENDWCFDYLPRHHRRSLAHEHRRRHGRRRGEGLFRDGREPGGRHR